MKILDYKWFTQGSLTIGIILIESNGEKKAYIGIGDGLVEGEDLEKIRDWGSKFPIEAAIALFPYHFKID